MPEKSMIQILAIDDQPLMLNLLQTMLTKLGYDQVTTCSSGQEGLTWLEGVDETHTIILLDLNMSEMDGIEFIRHLANRHFKGHLLLLSAEDERMRETVHKLIKNYKIASLGHLHKPVILELLSSKLGKWRSPQPKRVIINKKHYSADELRAAIANHEFINYYQPKVDIKSAKVVGVESLVRWHHPADGIVFPDQFIAIAEDHELIDDLTRTVIKAAFTQTKSWQDAGLTLQVAINISMSNLTDLNFANYLVNTAADSGISPSDIVLEVTESKLMTHTAISMEVLTRLRMHRFSLSIDDFGTGHSSLSQLCNIPFNELKIDQSFVHNTINNETQQAIFNASLGLAKQLGMKSIAEGVEDQADWDFIRSTDCDIAQGYFIAKPMPAHDIFSWIINWEATANRL
jgi:EAL domain-containing protein (putative c-di-GMP-specific phosphodiesterase class I)/ActR/RegA family two-component response regulator